ncbi:toxin-antitoxin system YwqK family antitoxin [Aquimarina rhabdastrellae]
MKKITTLLLSFLIGFYSFAQHLPLVINTSTPLMEKELKVYYTNGTLKEEGTLIDGKLHGAWTLFYNNGEIRKKGFFKNGKPHGVCTSYSKDGRVVLIERYSEGKEHGIWKSYYTNGQLNVVGEFVKGKRQGEWNIYDRTGIKAQTVEFNNDVEQKITSHYTVVNTNTIQNYISSID